MSDTHPSIGEGKTHEEMIRFWDNYAEEYTSMNQGNIPVQIVDRLVDLDIFRPEDDILEIGSGPGTYSVNIAPQVNSLVCLDSSSNMLKRLIDRIEKMEIDNVKTLCMDWMEFNGCKAFDTTIATLCPGSGSPESIKKMERLSRRYCVLISWYENHGDDLDSQIWKNLGKDYGYDFRHSTIVQDWLTDHGREPIVEFYQSTVIKDIPIDTIIRKQEASFREYGITEGVGDIVMKILSPELDDDILHYKATNTMKLIYWKSRDSS